LANVGRPGRISVGVPCREKAGRPATGNQVMGQPLESAGPGSHVEDDPLDRGGTRGSGRPRRGRTGRGPGRTRDPGNRGHVSVFYFSRAISPGGRAGRPVGFKAEAAGSVATPPSPSRSIGFEAHGSGKKGQGINRVKAPRVGSTVGAGPASKARGGRGAPSRTVGGPEGGGASGARREGSRRIQGGPRRRTVPIPRRKFGEMKTHKRTFSRHSHTPIPYCPIGPSYVPPLASRSNQPRVGLGRTGREVDLVDHRKRSEANGIPGPPLRGNFSPWATSLTVGIVASPTKLRGLKPVAARRDCRRRSPRTQLEAGEGKSPHRAWDRLQVTEASTSRMESCVRAAGPSPRPPPGRPGARAPRRMLRTLGVLLAW